MKMSEGGYVTDHLNDFNTVTSQLSSIGVNFDDEEIGRASCRERVSSPV